MIEENVRHITDISEVRDETPARRFVTMPATEQPMPSMWRHGITQQGRAVMRGLLVTLILLLPLMLGACGKESEKASASPAPPEVDIARPLMHSITEWDEYIGRFEAVEQVNVRTRVTGYLVKKKFKDGQIVKKGDVLFVIDPRPFKYAMQRVEAQYALAQKEYRRAEELRKTRAISQEDFDRRLQELKVAKAALNDARLDVEFTEVTAPIDGKISDGFVDIGNLVRENETILTRIVSVDPIHFTFDASQGELLKNLRHDRIEKWTGADARPKPIFIKLQDEDRYLHEGQMDFVDNRVDPGTGTIQARALVENRDALLYPGMFGRARLTSRGEYQAVLLPEKAINTDQDKKFVYVVDSANKAGRTYVTPGPVLDNGFVVIRDGLIGDELVVVNGVQRIRRADQIITPVETKLAWIAPGTMPGRNTVPDLLEIADSQAQPTLAAGDAIAQAD